MRYEDWDVLLFKDDPTLAKDDPKPPMKEFKTQCQVVYDHEFALTHGSYGLPTMTCFIPGLDTGAAFYISLHSWTTPQVTRLTKNNFPDHVGLVQWEARIFIDGRLIASACFDQDTRWPRMVTHSFDFTKNGELELLRFPPFRSELLQQSYWNPADELGRIKIVVSECFPRDSVTVPTERVKNIVAFSFQHAPLDVLERASIAWPNPAMWRSGPFDWTMPVPTEHPSDGSDSHIHSPRRRVVYPGELHLKDTNANFWGSMPNTESFLRTTAFDDSLNSQSHPVSPPGFNWNSLVPTDLATTLTHSLLNQPIPLVRQDSSANSPSSARTFSGVFSSRSASGNSQFGQNLTNVNPVTTYTDADGNTEKSAKRSRHATPASVLELDAGEELNRSTPRVRVGFGQDMAA